MRRAPARLGARVSTTMLAAAFCLSVPGPAVAEATGQSGSPASKESIIENSQHQRAPLFRLADDLSGSDPAILAHVEAILRDPPTTLEEIGFYGATDDPPRRRATLATIFALDEAGAIDSVEDKYLAEILDLWIERGVLDIEALPPEGQAVFGPLVERHAWGGADRPGDPASLEALEGAYGAATLQLEEHFRGQGLELLSIDATDGDTLHFALVAPDVAKRWRNVRLDTHGSYTPGIRDPLWDRFWGHLVYAVRLPTVGDTHTRPLPKGVRERVEDLPLAR